MIYLLLFAGLFMSRVVKPLGLPAVTGYLLAGVLIGPYCLGALGVTGLFTGLEELSGMAEIVQDVALGFIAFSIGNEFRLAQLKKIGKQATTVGILQAVITTLFVDAVLISLHFIIPDNKLPLSTAIVLAAIASATAPAATLMVVKQYKAKGPVTDILLPVVALDDAVGLILFSVSFGIAESLTQTLSLVSILVEPLLEIVLSIGLGAAMGALFTFIERFFHSRSKRLAVSVAFVLLTIGITLIDDFPPIGEVTIKFSPLLTCMMLGTMFCNLCDFSEELMDRVDRWTAPLFVIFFVISGAEFEWDAFSDIFVVLIGVAYIISRSAGKYFGSQLSSKLSKCDDNIVKYLGITLLPQAGVALGMANQVSTSAALGAEGALIANITLFAVLIYELVGPALTKTALLHAGEIDPEGKTSARHEHAKSKGWFHHLPKTK